MRDRHIIAIVIQSVLKVYESGKLSILLPDIRWDRVSRSSTSSEDIYEKGYEKGPRHLFTHCHSFKHTPTKRPLQVNMLFQAHPCCILLRFCFIQHSLNNLGCSLKCYSIFWDKFTGKASSSCKSFEALDECLSCYIKYKFQVHSPGDTTCVQKNPHLTAITYLMALNIQWPTRRQGLLLL